MDITVQPNVDNGNNQKKNTGITTGNEFIYKVDPLKDVKVTGLATSTGDATLYYSTDNSITPSDFSTLVISSNGAQTDDLGESLGKGIRWVGVEVTSGTWTVNVEEI